MFRLNKLSLMLVAGLFLYSTISYGLPVTWSTSGGGNGHQYEFFGQGLTWTQAKDSAISKGGHLATITSLAELQWIQTNIPIMPATWLGGYQDRTDNSYSEPSGAWKWVTGETWNLYSWNAGNTFFDNYTGFDDFLLGWYPNGYGWAQDAPNAWPTNGYVVEWETSAIPEPQTILLLGFSLSWMVKRLSFLRKK